MQPIMHARLLVRCLFAGGGRGAPARVFPHVDHPAVHVQSVRAAERSAAAAIVRRALDVVGGTDTLGGYSVD
jgi:hypothetical protein